MKTFTDAVLEANLKPNELRVLLALSTYADDDGKCWPSVGTIGTKANITSRSQVYAAITGLKDRGVISVAVRRKSSSSLYTILLEYDKPAQVEPEQDNLLPFYGIEPAAPIIEFKPTNTKPAVTAYSKRGGDRGIIPDGRTFYVPNYETLAEDLQESIRKAAADHVLATSDVTLVESFLSESTGHVLSARGPAYAKIGYDEGTAYDMFVDYLCTRYTSPRWADMGWMDYDLLIAVMSAEVFPEGRQMIMPASADDHRRLAKRYADLQRQHNANGEVLNPYTLFTAYHAELSKDYAKDWDVTLEKALGDRICDKAVALSGKVKLPNRNPITNKTECDALGLCRPHTTWDYLRSGRPYPGIEAIVQAVHG